MSKVYSLKEVQSVSCSNEIRKFREEIQQRFKILPCHQLYIEIPKDKICTLLFPIFGDFSKLEQNQQFKNLNLGKKFKNKIHNVFKGIVSQKAQQGYFIQKIRLNQDKIFINQQLFQPIKSIFDKITPRILSKSLSKVYFGFSEYNPQWRTPNLEELDKKSLIIPFKNQGKVILGIYEIQKSFSAQQINQILKNSRSKQQISPPKRKSQIKKSKKRNLDIEQKEQINFGSQVLEFEVRVKQQPFANDKVSIFFSILIIILSSLILSTIVIPSLNNSAKLQQKNLGQFQVQVLGWVYKVEKYTDPLKQKIKQIYVQNVSPHYQQYFVNPLQDISVYLDSCLPSLKNFIIDVTQSSKPQQNTL